MDAGFLEWLGALVEEAHERWGIGAAWLVLIAGLILLLPLALLLTYWMG